MKLFISWSKPRSKGFASVLRTWVPDVIQAVEPWMSQLDLDPGSRWSQEVSEQLAIHDTGIVCVTAQNLTEPWLHFEAGSIAKSVQSGVLIPVLHGISIADIQPTPLAQFQCVHSRNEGEMWQLVERLNSCEANALSSDRLRKYFDNSWTGYVAALDALDSEALAEVPPERDISDLLNDILSRLGSHSALLDEIVDRLGFSFEVDEREAESYVRIPRTLRSIPEVAEPTTDPFSLSVGDRVSHPAFGIGVIIDIYGDGSQAESVVQFDAVGTKTLAMAYAPLRLVEQASEGGTK